MNTRQKLGLWIFVSLMTLALLGCIGGGKATPTPTPKPTSTPIPPTATPAPTDTPAPTATPAPTDTPAAPPTEEATQEPEASTEGPILAVNGYRDSYDSLHVVGLIRNTTDHTISGVEIAVEIFDADGNSLYKDTTYLNFSYLEPGEISPFALWVSEDLPDADNFVATIVSENKAEIERADVTVRGVVVTVDDDGDIHVTGEVVNDGDTPAIINTVAAATFDADGGLLTADSHNVAIGYLDPGESAPFRVTMPGPASEVTPADYEVYVDAEVGETDQYDIFMAESDENLYLDSFDWAHLVGEITNQSDVPLDVRLVGGFYDGDGNTLDAASMDMPIIIMPGETLPYDLTFWGPVNYAEGVADKVEHYSVQIDPYWTWVDDGKYVDLTLDDEGSYDEDQATISGQVTNDSGNDLETITIVAYLREKETGNVIATNYTDIYNGEADDELILDGETLDFSISIDLPPDFDADAVEYVTLARGALP